MSSPYTIEFLPSAARQLSKLPKPDRRRLTAVIDGLAQNPRPPDCKVLKNRPSLYRVRAGNLRVIYSIEDERLIVLIVRVARRGIAYRGFPARGS